MEPVRFTTKALRAMIADDATPEPDREDAIEEMLARAATLSEREEGPVKRGFVDNDGY